ncbi:MAG: hypothetical protein DRO73_10040 [Candidatus Thorarchaeota archaeon]|nr:MAG: hypothetical protein DRO73_10040 [Candidatus Thorarchaeota archaeon]
MLYVLLVLKFNSELCYRDFVAQLHHRPLLPQRVGFSRPPSYSTLQQALTGIGPQLFHEMYSLIARRWPPPRHIAVCIERTLRRCFMALHAVVYADTLTFVAVTVRTRPSGIAKEFIPLLERVRHRSLEYVHADGALPFQEERVVCPRHRRTPGRQAGEVPKREGPGGTVATGSRSWSTGVTRRGGETPMAARAGASWRPPSGR